MRLESRLRQLRVGHSGARGETCGRLQSQREAIIVCLCVCLSGRAGGGKRPGSLLLSLFLPPTSAVIDGRSPFSISGYRSARQLDNQYG